MMNWKAWWEWSVAHQTRELGLLFIVIGLSRLLVLPLVGRRLLNVARSLPGGPARQLIMSIGFAALGLAIEDGFGLIANIDPPRGLANGGLQYSSWFAWWFWVGRGIGLATAMWLSWLVLVQDAKNAKKKDQDMIDAARRSED